MRTALLAPMYLAVSWVLTVSYQLFTDTAVKSIATNINLFWPTVSSWLNSNIQTIVFVYAFTWIFVLSSVIPSAILGKQRSTIIQYAVVLTLTLIAFFMSDILQAVAGIRIEQILGAATLLNNPIVAGFYLSVPFLLMISLDIHSKKNRIQEDLAKKEIFSEWEKIRQ
ncbi:hypothetical protein E4G67_04650 [Candidatus Bathyarchaeota archaeon]|nr:MAG: hypothetical protein E4G67_04650 [Candidatus Bathyarchaeota archaeon]